MSEGGRGGAGRCFVPERLLACTHASNARKCISVGHTAASFLFVCPNNPWFTSQAEILQLTERAAKGEADFAAQEQELLATQASE